RVGVRKIADRLDAVAADPDVGGARLGAGAVDHQAAGEDHVEPAQFQTCPRRRSRSTLPPLITATTVAPGSASIRPLSSAATGAAAAPSTTSLQRDIVQSSASKIRSSSSVTTFST